MTGPEHIGAIVERVVEKMSNPMDLEDVPSCLDEIDRLRGLMFCAANCDPKRDRPECYDPAEECDCSICQWWESDRCTVDGWEPPQ